MIAVKKYIFAIICLACMAAIAGCVIGTAPEVTPQVSELPLDTPVSAGTLSPIATPIIPVTPWVSASPSVSATPVPSPSATISATPKLSATPKRSPTPKLSPTPSPRPVQITQSSILSILKISKDALLAVKYYDLDGDGVKDAIALYQNEPVSSFVSRVGVSAINSATKRHTDISLPFDMGLQRNTIELTVLPVKKSGKTTVYAIAGGQYGGTVSHVGYSILKYVKSGWTDIFNNYRDTGMTYTIAMKNGPRAEVTLQNGQRFTLTPSDMDTYRAMGWIDSEGNLTDTAQVFGEHIGFSTVSFADEKGVLTLYGSQEIRGLHKLDVLATLDTVWQYDGVDWSVTANVIPVAGTLQ